MQNKTQSVGEVTPSSQNQFSWTRAATHHFGLEGRLDLLVLQPLPVYAAEKAVFPDVPFAFSTTAQALGRVFGHQLFGATQTKNLAFISISGNILYSLHDVKYENIKINSWIKLMKKSQ